MPAIYILCLYFVWELRQCYPSSWKSTWYDTQISIITSLWIMYAGASIPQYLPTLLRKEHELTGLPPHSHQLIFPRLRVGVMAANVIVEMVIKLVTAMIGLDALLPVAPVKPPPPPPPRIRIRHVISRDICASCARVIFSDNAMNLSHPIRGSKFL